MAALPVAVDHDAADPFGERAAAPLCRRVTALGARFAFRTDRAELFALVDAAYADLPDLGTGTELEFEIELRLTGGADFGRAPEPPPVRMQGGAGFFGAIMDGANLAIVAPAARRGLVAISRALLERFPYHARYELLEFAVFTLASRGRALVPLHAGCLASGGQAALLIGASGAGKSTLALHGMQRGFEFVTEDAAFVDPRGLATFGVANFLHLRADSLRFVDDAGLARRIAAATVIRRRSGVEKFEVDLRAWPGARLARCAPTLTTVVFVTPQPCNGGELLVPLDAAALRARLVATQAYAAGLSSWPAFAAQFARLRAFELRRAAHPRQTAEALHRLMAQ